MKKRNFWLYLLLSIITFGVYSIYFWYVWVEDVNDECEGDGKPSKNFVLVLVLSIITCGIYRIIWQYKQHRRMQEKGLSVGLNLAPNAGVMLALIILVNIVAEYFLIADINKFVE